MNPPKIEIKYQAKDNYGYYWHLVDSYGTIRGWSGQGFPTQPLCEADAQAAVAAMRDSRLRIVNAY